MDSRGYQGQRSPPTINTTYTGAMPQGRGGARRFSYADTPIDMREPVFGRGQEYRHNQEILHEEGERIAAGGVDGYHIQNSTSPLDSRYTSPTAANIDMTAQQSVPARPQRINSPYSAPEPQGVHPGYHHTLASPQSPNELSRSLESAPLISNEPHPPIRSSTIPMHSEDYSRQSPLRSPTKSSPIQPNHVTIPYTPHSLHSPTQPIFVPASMTGPNGMALEMHQPGQVAHPNMQNASGLTSDKGEWIHSLCECNADFGTCMTGLFCPCILDSKTAYRMGRRSEKKDPSDMLGFSNCNGRCGIFSCGLCCRSSPSHLPWFRARLAD
jgi:hypothetical protein